MARALRLISYVTFLSQASQAFFVPPLQMASRPARVITWSSDDAHSIIAESENGDRGIDPTTAGDFNATLSYLEEEIENEIEQQKIESLVEEIANELSHPSPDNQPENQRVEDVPAPTKSISDLKFDILRLSAATGRGAFVKGYQADDVSRLVSQLEQQNPTTCPAESDLLRGRWLLVYASEDATRSSPFFWAFRKLLDGTMDPRNPSQTLADAVFSVTDSIPIKDCGQVVQSIYGSELVSEVVISIGKVFPYGAGRESFFPSAESTMTTTSELQVTGPDDFELTVLTTQVKKSTLQMLLPFLPLDNVAFPVRDVFETLKPSSSIVKAKVTYLDQDFRVMRNENGKYFVFSRMD